MKFEVMINCARMKSKEECIKWTGAIKNNKVKGFRSQVRTVDEQELADAIREGHTIVPAILDEKQQLNGRYFQHQQVFGLDFDNKDPLKDDEKADDVHYMSFDRIMDVCRQYGIFPAVIYETFSSKPDWKKYRAIFVTDKPIDNRECRRMFIWALMKLFAVNGTYTTDNKCIDEGRIFYAGHTILSVYQNVPVNSDAVIEAAKHITLCELEKKQHNVRKPGKKEAAANEMVEAIMNQDVLTYTELLSRAVTKAANADVEWDGDPSDKTQTIICKYLLKDYCLGIVQEHPTATVSKVCGDVFELTSFLPLDLLLGLPYGKEFSCILPQHDDEEPSASINQLDDGRYVYNCWGCIDENLYFDVIEVFSLLMDVDIGRTIKFILTAIGLEVETEWQKQQKETIDSNIRYINSEYFQKRYSVLYKELVNAKAFGQLNFFLNYAREHMTPVSLTRDDRPTFFLSIRKASELMSAAGYLGTSKEAIGRKLILLCMLGFFDKVKENDIPAEVLHRAITVVQKNTALSDDTNVYRQDFLFIPAYTAKMFMDVHEFIIMNRENGVRRGTLTREQILRTYGKDAADSLYTQDTHREHSRRSVKFYSRYAEITAMLIASYGIISEAEILNRIKGYSSQEKKKLSGQCLPQLMMENGYQRIRVNKDNRAKYTIPDRYKSKCFVLIKASGGTEEQEAV